MHIVSGILQLLGALGIFLFGMKMLSEALQKVAGDRMRRLLSSITSNRFKGILTGMAVTASIQSSSATSVMVVSFVNAGLLTLLQAAGVIMGANIGTTITAWIISLLGFKVDISVLAIPIIGLTLPFLFSKHPSRRAYGELVFGFALLFMGLQYLKNSVPDLQNYPGVLEWLGSFSSYGIWSVLLFLLLGTVITIVVQSSSATVALTLIMCANGWMGFDMAAAMVLGENIGTTITANIAAMVGNVSSRRAAMFHTLFNVCGVVWAVALFPFLLKFVCSVVSLGGNPSPMEKGGIESIPIGISLFHTTFNVLNTSVLVWFAPQLVKLTTKIIPQHSDSDEEVFRLKHIGIGLLSTAELSLVQAKKETIAYVRRTYRMFGMIESMFEEKDEKEFMRISERVDKYETISDRVEIEIAEYLSKINTTELSPEGGAVLQGLLKIIDDTESVADYCQNINLLLLKKRSDGVWFNEHITMSISRMFRLVDDAFMVMRDNLEGDISRVDLPEAYEREDAINRFRNGVKQDHIAKIEKGVYSYQAGILYMDIIAQCERMGDSLINISEDIAEITNPLAKSIETEEFLHRAEEAIPEQG